MIKLIVVILKYKIICFHYKLKKFNGTITTIRCNYILVNDNCGNYKVQTWNVITELNPYCSRLKKRCQSTN